MILYSIGINILCWFGYGFIYGYTELIQLPYISVKTSQNVMIVQKGHFNEIARKFSEFVISGLCCSNVILRYMRIHEERTRFDIMDYASA